MNRTIDPALKAGIWVISDRFFDSTLAYQGYGHGIDLEFLNNLNRQVSGQLEPDLTFILDAPSKIGVSRALERGGIEDRYERFIGDFHEKAKKGFEKIASDNPKRCRLIDATKPIGQIRQEVSDHFVARFKLQRIKRSINS